MMIISKPCSSSVVSVDVAGRRELGLGILNTTSTIAAVCALCEKAKILIFEPHLSVFSCMTLSVRLRK